MSCSQTLSGITNTKLIKGFCGFFLGNLGTLSFYRF